MKLIRFAVLALLSTGVLSSVVADDYSYGYDYRDFGFAEKKSSADEFGFYGEGLYWTAQQESVPFAIKNEYESGVVSDVNTQKNHYHDHKFKHHWSWGFRLGADFVVPCSDWAADLRWTHFNNRTHGCAKGVVQNENKGTDFSNIFIRGDDFHSKWKLNFDTVDLLFGKTFCPKECLNIRPYTGLKFDYIQQKVDSCASLDLTNQNAKQKTLFEGGGIVLGSLATWDLGCGFGLYSNLGVGLVYGYSRSKVCTEGKTFAVENPEVLTNEVNYVEKWGQQAGKVNLDFALGLDWNHCFQVCDFSLDTTFNIGYEYHQYFNQNAFLQSDNGQGSYFKYGGDLILQGLTFGGGIRF